MTSSTLLKRGSGNYEALDLYQGSSNNTVSNVSLTSPYDAGIGFYGDQNNVTNVTVNGSYGFYFSNSGFGCYGNSVSNSSTLLNATKSINSTGTAYNNILLNVSFNESKMNWGAGNNNITIEWYARVNVTNSSGSPVSGAYVNLTDVYGSYNMTNVQTDATGLTGWVPVWEWAGNDTVNYTYNNHTADAANSTFWVPVTSSSNITSETTITSDAIIVRDAHAELHAAEQSDAARHLLHHRG